MRTFGTSEVYFTAEKITPRAQKLKFTFFFPGDAEQEKCLCHNKRRNCDDDVCGVEPSEY